MRHVLASIFFLLPLLSVTAQTPPDTLREGKLKEVTIAGQRRQVVYRLDRKRVDA